MIGCKTNGLNCEGFTKGLSRGVGGIPINCAQSFSFSFPCVQNVHELLCTILPSTIVMFTFEVLTLSRLGGMMAPLDILRDYSAMPGGIVPKLMYVTFCICVCTRRIENGSKM